MLKYNLKDLTKAYQNGIVNKAIQNGHIYQRIITPMYRTITSDTYCVDYDLYGTVEDQISQDGGQTWTTTSSTEVLIEHESETCGYIDYTKRYLTFNITSDGNIGLEQTRSTAYYSLDNGETWNTIYPESHITVHAGDKIMWKYAPNSTGASIHFMPDITTCSFTAEGNLLSLLYGDDFIGKTSLEKHKNAFSDMFYGCKITSAENLVMPVTSVTQNACLRMFSGCTSLTKVNEDLLPATTLDTGCYGGMFAYCSNLTTPPKLPAPTLVQQCYQNMFFGCSKLKEVTCLAQSGINTNSSTSNWMGYNVPNTGTFYKKAGANWGSCDTSTIHCGWTVVNV